MSMYDKRRKRLINELRNKEYRHAYVSSGIDVSIAFQIRALRKQRGWNQTKLAEMTGMKQESISSLENPDHPPSLSTLKKLANGLGVGLIVKFISLSDLLEWELNLSSESLKVISFDEDPYFQVEQKEKKPTADSDQFIAISTSDASSKVIPLKHIRNRNNSTILSDVPIRETPGYDQNAIAL